MSTVRVTLTLRGVRFVELFPICNQETREIAENAESAEDAFNNQNRGELEGNQLDFIFGNNDNQIDIAVDEWDDEYYEKGDEITYDEDIEPFYYTIDKLLSPDFQKETGYNLPDNLDSNGYYLASALKDLFNGAIAPNDFILEAMRRGLVEASHYYTLSDENEEDKKPHYGVVCAAQLEEEDFTIAYSIELEDDEEFVPDELCFIIINQRNENISPIIGNMLNNGWPLLNVVLYKGKAYFAGHDDYLEDGGYVEYEDSSYDIINMDLGSRKKS